MTGHPRVRRPRAVVLVRRYPDQDGHVPSASELDAWRAELEAARARDRAERRRRRRRRERATVLFYLSPWIALALLIVLR